MLARWLLALLLLLGPVSTGASAAASGSPGLATLELVGGDGRPLDPASLQGQVVLVVNVASFCGYTPQYAGLQRLHEAYADRGLVVLGVPSNEFGGQEPGSDAEIRNFCRTRYGVTFPLLRKQHVNGAGRSPLYRWLVGSAVGGGRDVGWNFEKFLVGRDGRVMARFGSHVVPEDEQLITALELALAEAP